MQFVIQKQTFSIITSWNIQICNYYKRDTANLNGAWGWQVDLLWKCFCSALSMWYTRRFEQINTCTKPSGKKREQTLEHIISTNRPADDGNDLRLPVERSTKILLAALLLLLQQTELLIFTGVCVLEVDPFKLIPPSHKGMKTSPRVLLA